MGPDQGVAVTTTGLALGPNIAEDIKQLEEKVAKQARKDLPLAAAGGRTSDVVQAIEFGAEVNLTLNGYTSLMRAANWGHVDTVAALIAEGADMFATDQRGRTALDWARIARRDKVVRTLERAMENEIRYRRESTKAVRSRRELWGVVQANAKYARQVATAVETRDLEEIRRIIARAKLTRPEFSLVCERLGFKADGGISAENVLIVDGIESSPSSSSSVLPLPVPPLTPRNNTAGLEGVRVPVFYLDAEGLGGTTALALATIQNDAETVRRLVKEGADPGVESRSGHTALTWAAVCGFDLIVVELLDHRGTGDGAMANLARATVKEGRTALHHAAASGNSEVVVLLLDRLRDSLLRDSFGKRRQSDDTTGPGLGWFHPFRDFLRRKDCNGCTALELAQKAGYDEVASLLDNADGRTEMWETSDRAQEHALERIECGNEGCRHRDRRDRMERHEAFECPRRPAGCPACGAKLVAAEFDFHQEKVCDKRKEACPNAAQGCYDVMPHGQIAAHITHVCKFRRVLCRRRCGASLAAHLLELHEQEHCRLSKHPCVFGCGQDVSKASMGAHIKKDCPKRKVRCRLGCGSDVEAGRLAHHETEVCVQACCWEGCGERLGPSARRETHERYLCPHRPAECPHGCGVRGLTAVLKEAHALHHCHIRPVACPHGCGTSIPCNELPAHVRVEGGTCPERLQRCRFDCLQRRIMVARREKDEDEEGARVHIVPGMLKFYDVSTGLFGIRYSNGNRQEALENLDFVWADQGGVVSGTAGDGGGGSSTWGCGWVAAADMADHLEHACPRRSTLCRDGCGQSLVVREVELHYQGGCPKRFMLCSLGCGAEVRQENLGEHVDELCSLRRTPCEACGVPVPLQKLPEHTSDRCSRVPRRCTNGCGALVRGDDLPHHLSDTCPKRLVPCPLGCPEAELWAEEVDSHNRDHCPLHREPCRRGCGMEVAVCSRAAHEERECVERLVVCGCGVEHALSKAEDHRIMDCRAVVCYCSLGCGVKVRKMDMDRHQEEDCERKTLRALSKMIECPLGCRHLILRQWEFQHRVFDCPKRPARCPGGCSEDVSADEAAVHFMTCGRRRIRCGADSTGCERMLQTWVGLTEASMSRAKGAHGVAAVGVQAPGSRRQRPSAGLVPCSDHGSDALMWAASKGDAEKALLTELLDLTGGAGIDRESTLGDTALTIACARGHVDTVRTLVRAGHADVNYETRAGKTPLIEAARYGRSSIVRLLMELRAVIPYKNRRGQTAAWWAQRLGHRDCLVPMTRAIKAEATLRYMSSQIARGDVSTVRSLVELGEPYRDNHCKLLEAEIDGVTDELDKATREKREMSTVMEQLTPELERLKATLAEDQARRSKIQHEAARDARRGGGGGGTANGKRQRQRAKNASITSRSFQAMQTRALTIFQRSVTRLQALTDEDFTNLAKAVHTPPCTDETVDGTVADGGNNKNASSCGTVNEEDRKEVADPAPSLAAPPRRRGGSLLGGGKILDYRGCSPDDADETEEPNQNEEAKVSKPTEGKEEETKKGEEEEEEEEEEEGGQGWSRLPIVHAKALRVLRAAVIVLGGCGLGALPSDMELWRAVRPMLLNGSLRHRIRHFDRRVGVGK